MQITDMSVNVVDVGQGFSWGGRMAMEVIGIFVAIETEAGLEGHALAWTAELPAAATARAIELAIKPHVLGANLFDRPRILSPAWRGFRVGLPLAAIGVVDVALWDLAGKATGVSISELLGRQRDRIKACASDTSRASTGPSVQAIPRRNFCNASVNPQSSTYEKNRTNAIRLFSTLKSIPGTGRG